MHLRSTRPFLLGVAVFVAATMVPAVAFAGPIFQIVPSSGASSEFATQAAIMGFKANADGQIIAAVAVQDSTEPFWFRTEDIPVTVETANCNTLQLRSIAGTMISPVTQPAPATEPAPAAQPAAPAEAEPATQQTPAREPAPATTQPVTVIQPVPEPAAAPVIPEATVAFVVEANNDTAAEYALCRIAGFSGDNHAIVMLLNRLLKASAEEPARDLLGP